jgi:hypothetical protein
LYLLDWSLKHKEEYKAALAFYSVVMDTILVYLLVFFDYSIGSLSLAAAQ